MQNTQPNPHLTTRPGYPLKATLTYRSTKRVTVFGIERNDDDSVIYYWVVDAAEKRFKAYPNELAK